MPGKTLRGSQECQITWEGGEDVVQAGSTSNRRVSRGALKQEADTERKRRGFFSLDRKKPPSEEVREARREDKSLDLFTSPFRALAESCGFKVIREEDASDTNSLRSQAGSSVSESDDAFCHDDHVNRKKADKARPRRDTPGLYISSSRTLSPVRVGFSSEEEAEDSPGIRQGNLVLQRQSLGTDASEGDNSPEYLNARIKSPRNCEGVKKKKKSTITQETRSGHICKEHSASKNQQGKKQPKYDHSHCRKEQTETPTENFGTSKELETQRRKKSDYSKNRSENNYMQQYNGGALVRGDCSCSAEESGSTGTYRSVKEALSPEETGKANARKSAKNSGLVNQRSSVEVSARQGKSSDDFKESSTLKGQAHQSLAKPYACRQQKIFLEMLPGRSLRDETEHQVSVAAWRKTSKGYMGINSEESAGKNIARVDGCKRSCERQRGDDVEPQSTRREPSEPIIQAVEDTQRTELRRPGAGAAFRISRKFTNGSKGSSCGVIRYFRSGSENGGLQNGRKRCDLLAKEKAEKSDDDYDRKQSAACLGAGDGNITMQPRDNTRMTTGKDRTTRAIRQVKADIGAIDGCESENCEKGKMEHSTSNLHNKFEETQQSKRHQEDCNSTAKGKTQRGDLSKYPDIEKDRDTIEKQMFSEISKLRAHPVPEPDGCDQGNIETSRMTTCAQKETRNAQTIGLGDRELQGISSDKEIKPTNLEPQINPTEAIHQREYCKSDNSQTDWNPLSPTPTDIRNLEPGYIHQQAYRDDAAQEKEHQELPQLNTSETREFDSQRSDSTHFRRNNQEDRNTFAANCGCRHHIHCFMQNNSTQQNHCCQTRHACHQDTHMPSHKPQPHLTTKAGLDSLAEPANFTAAKLLKFMGPPRSLWEGHKAQVCYKSTTDDRERNKIISDRQVTVDNTLQSTTNSTGGERNGGFKVMHIAREPGEDATSNHAQHQHQQRPPLPLHHHKDSGFNINFNYEGSEDGDSGSFGSRFIGQYFLELWKNQCLCDVRLRVGNWSYLAHKIVLAAFSDFFCPNDPHCMPSICFDIPNATPDAVHQILLYLYTSEMEITDYTLDSVLCAAESLGVSEVINLVKEILENPTTENFEHYLDIRGRHGFPGRLADYTELIREHLLDLTSSQYFLEFDLADLQQVLGDPEVKVDSEVDIIDVIARWVEYNPMERIQHTADLLAFVNFDCIPAESLADVVERKRHVFSRDAFSIFLDAFKARSVSAECPPCPPAQNLWNNGIGNSGPATPQNRQTNATNKSTNADIYRPIQLQQQQHQQPVCYDLGEANATQNRTLNGGNFQDHFRSPSKSRRENARIPRSCQNKISTLIGQGSRNSWASDAGTSRPSSGMSSRLSSIPRRFATTQSTKMAAPRDMSITSRSDCEPTASWVRPGKRHRISRVNVGGAGFAFREPIGVPSDPAHGGLRGRRGSGIYRCSNGNAVFSPPTDSDVNCGHPAGGALPVSSAGGAPIWDDGNTCASLPTSPGWSRGSGGSFVASPWMPLGPSTEAPPPGCSTFRVTRGGRGPRWEQRSRSPSASQGSRDRSSSKRVTFMR